VAAVNPFRYRGYFYDSETQLYYLQSRYYNPVWGRFVNSDGIIGANGDIIGTNMFAYCINDPVNAIDPTGLCKECGYMSQHDVVPGTNYRATKEDYALYGQLRHMGFLVFTLATACYLRVELPKHGIDTPEEMAHFFAQVAVETGFGENLLEVGVKPWLYMGAGYLQLTNEDNYKLFCEAKGRDPQILSEGAKYVAKNYAWDSAFWYWDHFKINERIANGATVRGITEIVNGPALNGLSARESLYQKFLGILS
jgi:RHS repeat-associated protein